MIVSYNIFYGKLVGKILIMVWSHFGGHNGPKRMSALLYLQTAKVVRESVDFGLD